jgi:hypothetical protein
LRKPRLLATTLTLAALVIPIGMVAWLEFAADDELSALSISAEPILTSATARTVTDERAVRLVPTIDKGPEVLAPRLEGIVTAVYVKPGERLADGKPVLSVSGIDRLGFSAPTPFYRPISAGTEGPDVESLHRLLVALGRLPAMPPNAQTATFATGAAVRALAAEIGAPATSTFDPGWVVWLPRAGLVAATVAVRPGQPAPAPGSVIITTPGKVTAARIAAQGQEPLTLAPGVEYVAVAAGKTLRIDSASLQVADADLGLITPPEPPNQEGIAAFIRRATPLQAMGVPSTAVMVNDAGQLCVWLPAGSAYRAATVTVAGARGGITNVATGLTAGQQVLSNPAQVLERPQCP